MAASASPGLIDLYRVHVSPRKGWHCAWSVGTGGASCSTSIRAFVSRRGALGALVPSVRRLLDCRRAWLALSPEARVSGVCCCGPIPIPFRSR